MKQLTAEYNPDKHTLKYKGEIDQETIDTVTSHDEELMEQHPVYSMNAQGRQQMEDGSFKETPGQLALTVRNEANAAYVAASIKDVLEQRGYEVDYRFEASEKEEDPERPSKDEDHRPAKAEDTKSPFFRVWSWLKTV
ncbi:hypothetical protein GF351_00020 [Candidatus Woesearchaeota archaeon]|nr:hypothetical protein [Candidatus Woesearchaeota archaeon]